MMNTMLIGNAFPMSLIRRPVLITPIKKEVFTNALRNSDVVSFWGHQNTLQVAKAEFGIDLTPATERPAIKLSPSSFPMLDGLVFNNCWVVSPSYVSGFRPAVGEEVPPEVIQSWQVLQMDWQPEAAES